MNSISTYNPIGLPLKYGFLAKQSGNHKRWKKRFFILKDEYLYYFKSRVDEIPCFEISLKNAEIKNDPNPKNTTIFMIFPESKEQETKEKSFLSLSAKTQEEKENWINSIEKEIRKASRKVIGSLINDVIKLRNDGKLIPEIIEKIIEFLKTNENENKILETEGLFTKSFPEEIKELITDLNRLKSIQLESIKNPHLIIELLITYFKELPVPLLTNEFYDEFKEELSNDKKELIQRFIDFFDKLSFPVYETLKYLIEFLEYITLKTNRFTVEFISKIFSKILFSQENKTEKEQEFQDRLIEFFIQEFGEIFVCHNNSELKFVRAIHNYVPQGWKQLSLEEGEIIQLIRTHSSGWWVGKLKGNVGLFPFNYTQFLTEDEKKEENQNFNQKSDYELNKLTEQNESTELELCIEQAQESNEKLEEIADYYHKHKQDISKENLIQILSFLTNEVKTLEKQLEKETMERTKLQEKLLRLTNEQLLEK
ncbi:rho gtpase-activating protein [Anaeramoeba ignava]|uniref:Rho gtpase-activating protein n=1 Tax=Anaeramoeba ignava TaxID=1746090 RepID=A0A9Q0RAD1_ANAIG|nr:rho gtpase-activating protein [Anaeramoeba ignava]